MTQYAKEGIDDYIMKENLLRLAISIENVVNKKRIEKLHHQLENVHGELKKSIHYARIIQDAMLPKKEVLSMDFPESFILYKPKDVVSGDFYWFKKTEDIFYIAVADCTGHGVPGACMSVIGSEKLNDAVLLNTDTSGILKHLNQGIKTFLHQSENSDSTRDGMDIALCSIDIKNRIVKYAGANRPLWIIRKEQDSIEEIKPTKKAIGGFTEDNQHYDSHQIELQKGDTFYIFSDGYADTFGGSDDKKMKTKKFKQILLDIQNKTMLEQGGHLDDFVERWKAGREQIDDILVVGIEL